ncbi:hypothetical protein CCZ01_01730 [Helicobacter monodelphidis]|uniref:EAL domain-containing protein n=1 Tax=Helicobacter sp. 15-1451 TaxID=2004995 RepID=UPI000DCEA4BF|nr:EAL domain-containing protein [Helicobacter sp. 15-1451]RAX58937.1 hypothetical protein CCZ01_01730 [Helicobacter sp. 15-1451]
MASNKILKILNIAAKNNIPSFEEFFTFCETINVPHLKAALEFIEKEFCDIVLFWELPIDDDLFDTIRIIHSINMQAKFLIISQLEFEFPQDLRYAQIKKCPTHASNILTEISKFSNSFLGENDFFAERSSLNECLHGKQEYILALLQVPTIMRCRLISALESIDSLIAQIQDFLSDYRPRGTRVFVVDSDTFVILFFEASQQEVYDFVSSLDVLRLEHDFIVDGHEIDVEFISGIVCGKGKALLPKAYSAVEEAKRTNTKICVLEQSDEEFFAMQQRNIHWMKAIHLALKNNRIVPFYQPIVNNVTQKVEKYETLVRLLNHDGSVVRPDIFLGVAKESGLMNNISMSVINKSFSFFKDLDLEFSINISEEGLRDRQIVNYLLNRCERYGIHPSRVLLEVLEDIDSIKDKVLEHINELHGKGFKIAIDDFGAANSNFGRLIDMKADYIKIDGSFVKNIDTDERSYKIVDSIAKFAKGIGVKSVAEFVHSDRIYQIICEMGIDYSQGFYFGKPSPTLL